MVRSNVPYKYGKNKEARSIVSKKELLVPISVSKFSCSCRRGLPVAVLGSHMYCLGPIVSNPSSNSNQVWTLDLTSASTSSSNCWKPGPHTNFTRWNPHVMVLDNKLYALGSCHPDFEAESSGCGWMEVFHPKLGTWESLPNPPSRCFLQRIMLSAPLHDKKQIVVAERCNGCVTFHIYNGCGTSNSSISHFKRYRYVKVGRTNATDVVDLCKVEQIFITSWPGNDDPINISCADVHNELVYGFELSWLTGTCKSYCGRRTDDCSLDDGNHVQCRFKAGKEC